MITAAELPLPLQDQLRHEALRAFPRECCGLIEGTIDGASARLIALHPMRNIANEADRFEIDPAGHIALLRSLRGTGRELIGCYHSHPNGRAEPSEHDRQNAMESDFLWLICTAKAGTRESSVTAFVSVGRSFLPLRIVHLPATAGAFGPT